MKTLPEDPTSKFYKELVSRSLNRQDALNVLQDMDCELILAVSIIKTRFNVSDKQILSYLGWDTDYLRNSQ